MGAIWLASLKEIRSPNLPMVGLIATGGASLIGIALAPHLAMVSVCVYNMATVANLAYAPEEMRGQSLTLMNVVQGTILIGTLIAGARVDSLGSAGRAFDDCRLSARCLLARPLNATRPLVDLAAPGVLRPQRGGLGASERRRSLASPPKTSKTRR